MPHGLFQHETHLTRVMCACGHAWDTKRVRLGLTVWCPECHAPFGGADDTVDCPSCKRRFSRRHKLPGRDAARCPGCLTTVPLDAG